MPRFLLRRCLGFLLFFFRRQLHHQRFHRFDLCLKRAVKLALALALIASAFAGCSGSRLPPGTPPPEYEPPQIAPWSPESSDAGTDSSPPPADGAAGATSPPAAAPELSLDAGPR